VPLTLKSAYIGEWILGVRCQEVWSGRSFGVRDVGQSAIHVIGLCLCDVTVKRCYRSICIFYESSLDKSPLLRNASRMSRDVVLTSFSFNFLIVKPI
jgi:hypothetical protein